MEEEERGYLRAGKWRDGVWVGENLRRHEGLEGRQREKSNR